MMRFPGAGVLLRCRPDFICACAGLRHDCPDPPTLMPRHLCGNHRAGWHARARTAEARIWRRFTDFSRLILLAVIATMLKRFYFTRTTAWRYCRYHSFYHFCCAPKAKCAQRELSARMIRHFRRYLFAAAAHRKASSRQR